MNIGMKISIAISMQALTCQCSCTNCALLFEFIEIASGFLRGCSPSFLINVDEDVASVLRPSLNINNYLLKVSEISFGVKNIEEYTTLIIVIVDH